MIKYNYRYLNTSLQTNFDFFILNKYQLFKKVDKFDVNISLKKCSNKDLDKKSFFDVGLKSACLHYEKLGHFSISEKGKNITCYFNNKKKNYINFMSKLLNHAIPYALYQQKKFCLHASALEINNSGFLFLGQPGSGKSSLAAHLSRYLNLICEDSSVIVEMKNKLYILPSLPVVKVEKDVANLCKLKDSIGRLNDNRNREYYSIENYAKKPVEVTKCIYLSWADDYEIDKISSKKQKLGIIFSSAYTATHLTNCKKSSQTLMKHACAMINNVDFYVLRRPKDYNFHALNKLLHEI